MRSRLSVNLCDVPLLRHEIALAADQAGWDGPAVVGPARAVGTRVVVDPSWVDAGPPPTRVLGPAAALLPLDGPGVQVLSLGPEIRSVHATLECAL